MHHDHSLLEKLIFMFNGCPCRCNLMRMITKHKGGMPSRSPSTGRIPMPGRESDGGFAYPSVPPMPSSRSSETAAFAPPADLNELVKKIVAK